MRVYGLDCGQYVTVCPVGFATRCHWIKQTCWFIFAPVPPPKTYKKIMTMQAHLHNCKTKTGPRAADLLVVGSFAGAPL